MSDWCTVCGHHWLVHWEWMSPCCHHNLRGAIRTYVFGERLCLCPAFVPPLSHNHA